jgi:hypothetical protein
MSTTQSQQTRLERIKQLVSDISTTHPRDTDVADAIWFKPDRGSADYHRLSSTRDDEELAYDVWLELRAEYDRIGYLEVSAEILVAHATTHDKVWNELVFSKSFSGNHQPREQCFLNNYPHHIEAVEEAFETAVEGAEMWFEERRELDP